MRISLLLVAALLFAAFTGSVKAALRQVTASTPATHRQTAGPGDLVRDLYRVRAKDLRSESDTILNGKDRKLIDKYFDKSLSDLIWKDLTNRSDEAGVIDFDIFYNTQDPQITNLRVGQAVVKGDKATVPVTFYNFEKKETVTYLLTNNGGKWKITDIHYGGGFTLLKYFTEGS